ncbi:MAG: response regulator transcription factor, partial [Planctomycetales bacterium]|nr:response regulator transcription factor [Planctomycetales bacterium]
REYDVDVMRAYFGMQGFWQAITSKPDVILMDVAMPNGDGRYVLESLRQNRETESIPVIILTGMRDQRLRSALFALGADQYLQKPVHFDALLHELSRFVDLRPHEMDASDAPLS